LQHLIHGFPLSGPESGHTERRAAHYAAVATVLFHPDSNRRLRNHTESADPFSQEEKKALAGLGYFTFTAGGDFHPALRTSAARLGDLTGIWPMAGFPASGPAMSGHGESACPHDAKARQREISGAEKLTIGARGARNRACRLASSESDSGLF
jgi:hypothetical protein